MFNKWYMPIHFYLISISTSISATPFIIGAEDDWAPYSFMSEKTSQIDGLTPSIVKAAFEAEGIEIIIRPLPYARCMLYSRTGKILGCFNAAITKQNKNQYFWHKTPLFEEELAIFALSSEHRRNVSISDLKGSKVGITIGYDYPSNFMKDPTISRFQAKSDSQIIEMLVRNRVNFILMANLPGHLKIHKKKLDGKVVKVGVISKDAIWVAFSRQHSQGESMARRFEDGLRKIQNNGTYSLLIHRIKIRLGL